MVESADQGPQFMLQKIYIRDFSFEAPTAPEVFLQAQGEWEPQINFQLQNKSRELSQPGIYEDVLEMTVTVKMGEQTAFLVELQQAGIFAIQGVDQPTLSRLLAVECLGILFPYAREAVSDVVTKGGFPPLLLAPVNFEALYQQQLQQQQQGAPAEGAPVS